MIHRRSLIRLCGLGLLGLSLPALLRAESRPRPAGPTRPRPRARSCILFFMEGGPAHQDIWDMKPDAPLEYRGEFRPIPTKVPGLQVCEHLPLLAGQMHHAALVRSVTHDIRDHNAGAYYALTGRSPLEAGELIRSPSGKLFPTYGSVLAKLRPTGRPIPDFVHIPEVLSNLGFDLPGRRMPDALSANETVAYMGEHHRKAFELLGSPAVRDAFDLGRERDDVRERYGFDLVSDRKKLAREFGGVPHLGQSMLLARRLVEAGVRLVTVCAGKRLCQAWDTHRQHFPLMKRSLMPMTDRAFSALLADLHQRGLLEETLVVAMGEFGRTPRVGQITSDAGADKGGRDHWPHCYTVFFAGGGVQGGAIHGASDRHAAFPEKDPVTPEDIAATIYHAMGVEPETEIVDPLDRPLPVAIGKPIESIFG